LTTGTVGSAGLEGLVIRGALADRLGSLESVLDGIRCVCGADDCELFLVDPSGREVFLVDCEGHDRAAFMERTRMPLGVGYAGMITLQQQSRFTNHFQHDRSFVRKAVKRRGIRSFVGVPLNHAGRPLGYLGVGWRDDSVPLQWGLRVLEEVKSMVRLAIPPRLLPQTGSVMHAAPLVIRCFGPFEVVRDGRLLPASAFARRKALRLLQTLVLRRGAPMHRDELIELLWPGVPARSGANRLHGVLNVLRSALETGRSVGVSRYIVCRDNQYFFDTQAPHCVDLFDFLDLLASARVIQRQGGDERALGPLEDAVALYRGDLFAGDTDSDSFDLLRVNLRHSYLDAVRALVGLRIRWGQADSAVALMRTALEFEPEALDLHEALVTQLVRAGRISEARQQYDCCRAALRRYVDLELPPRITALEKLLH
jgi:DNA-binding SARP family transcriptional activator